MNQIFVTAVVFLASLAAAAAELVVAMPGRDALIVDVPPGWTSEVKRERVKLPPTITLTAADAQTFKILITPIWPAAGNEPTEREEIRGMVKKAASEAASQAFEQELLLREFTAPAKHGYYFFATDRNPKPNEYKYLTQGTISYGELRIAFTALSNDAPEASIQQAIGLLSKLQRRREKPGTV